MFVFVDHPYELSKVVTQGSLHVSLSGAQEVAFSIRLICKLCMHVAGRTPGIQPLVPALNSRSRADEVIVIHSLRGEARSPVSDCGLNTCVRHWISLPYCE